MLINTMGRLWAEAGIVAAALTMITAIVRSPTPEIPKLMPPPPPEHWGSTVDGAAP
jgi:hypothetical protein